MLPEMKPRCQQTFFSTSSGTPLLEVGNTITETSKMRSSITIAHYSPSPHSRHFQATVACTQIGMKFVRYALGALAALDTGPHNYDPRVMQNYTVTSARQLFRITVSFLACSAPGPCTLRSFWTGAQFQQTVWRLETHHYDRIFSIGITIITS